VGSLADAVDRAVRIALADLASDQASGRCRQFI
jgi:hypothetical protein